MSECVCNPVIMYSRCCMWKKETKINKTYIYKASYTQLSMETSSTDMCKIIFGISFKFSGGNIKMEMANRLWQPFEEIEPTCQSQELINTWNLKFKKEWILLFSFLSSGCLKLIAFVNVRHFKRTIPFWNHSSITVGRIRFTGLIDDCLQVTRTGAVC